MKNSIKCKKLEIEMNQLHKQYLENNYINNFKGNYIFPVSSSVLTQKQNKFINVKEFVIQGIIFIYKKSRCCVN